jgi:hypothetical protein
MSFESGWGLKGTELVEKVEGEAHALWQGPEH